MRHILPVPVLLLVTRLLIWKIGLRANPEVQIMNNPVVITVKPTGGGS